MSVTKTLALAFLSGLIAAGATLIVTPRLISSPPQHTTRDKEKTAFERVRDTGELRCAYISWSASYFMKNPNTGEYQGVGYDLAEAMAQSMNVKIIWTEEVGVGNMYEGLRTGRYDAICTPVWQGPTDGAHATFTRPAYYSPTYAYARGDDSRFDLHDPQVIANINKKDVIVVDVEGSNGVEIHRNSYPQAKKLFLPGMTPAPDIIANVLTKKADITQQNPAFVKDFLVHNPDALKQVTKALMVFPTSILVVPKGDQNLQEWADMAVEAMIQIGTMDRILNKYDPDKTLFLRADHGYTR